MERNIAITREIPADILSVWKAWTTVEGVKTFFAPSAKIDLKPGGLYEMYFMPDQPAGLRGSEGCVILALDEPRLLSFTWNAPPPYPEIRRQRTHVSLYMEEVGKNRTRISLNHDGWGLTPQWQGVYDYFKRVWEKVVLARFIYSLENGPINWDAPQVP
ncbi:MAG: SRPBCC domain-containing protein [Calditrichia bacterium]